MSSRWEVAADDPTIISRACERRYRVTTNPRHRLILETCIEHIRTETIGDLDGVMATIGAEAEWRHYWGPPDDPGHIGRDAVRAHYASMFATGALGNVRPTNHRLSIDDHAIISESTLTRIVPWEIAKQAGYVVPVEEGHYALSRRLANFVLFDDEGLMCGELSYGGPANPLHCERVPDDELSPGYRRWLEETSAISDEAALTCTYSERARREKHRGTMLVIGP